MLPTGLRPPSGGASSSAGAAAAAFHSPRARRYLLLGAGVAAASYAAYRLYHSEAAAEGRQRLARLRAAIAAYADAFGTGADTLQLLLADLQAYLQSDRHEVPPSLRQLARLMQSPEVADTTSATVAALIRGVTGAVSPRYAAAAPTNGSTHLAKLDGAAAAPAAAGKGALDKVLEALLSDRGHSLVSVAVSLGARNLVTAYCDAQHRLAAADQQAAAAVLPGQQQGQQQEQDVTSRLLDFLASPRGQQLAVLTVTAFVSNGMRTYLDQTLDLNFYEDLFAAMAKPEHLDAVKQCVGVFARDVVGTYLAGPQAQQAAGDGAAARQQQQLRLSTSIHELLNGAATGQEQRQQDRKDEEAPADSGSPCGSSVSGDWQRQRASQQPAAALDVDSEPEVAAAAAAKAGSIGGGGDSARSQESWAVRTPEAAAEVSRSKPAAAAAAGGGQQGAPMLPQLRRVQQQGLQQQQQQLAAAGGLQREGSGNLEWISAVSKEWLNVAQHPHGRTVMVELAGTAAKEAARGVSAALADRFRMEWLLLAAFAMLLLAWLAQRMLGALLG